MRDEIRNHAERVAQDSGLQTEFVRRKFTRFRNRERAAMHWLGRVASIRLEEPTGCFG